MIWDLGILAFFSFAIDRRGEEGGGGRNTVTINKHFIKQEKHKQTKWPKNASKILYL